MPTAPRAPLGLSSQGHHPLRTTSQTARGSPEAGTRFLAKLKENVTASTVLATSEEEIRAVSAPLSVLRTSEPRRASLADELERPSPRGNGEGVRGGNRVRYPSGFPEHCF